MGRDKGVRTRVRRAWGHWGQEDAKERVPPEAGVQGQRKETWVDPQESRKERLRGVFAGGGGGGARQRAGLGLPLEVKDNWKDAQEN